MKNFWLHGLFLIFIPNITYVVIGAPTSAGILATSLCGLLIEFKTTFALVSKIKYLTIFVLTFSFLILWGLYCFFYYGTTKPLLSSSIVFMFLYAFILSSRLLKIDNKHSQVFLDDLKRLSYFMIMLGWIKIVVGSSFGPYAIYEKALFPYSEDSHFGLTFGIFCCGYLSGSNNTRNAIFILVNTFLLALFLPSLILLVIFAIAFSIFFITKTRKIRYIYFFSILISSTAMLTLLLNSEYFSERLDITGFENLTMLVWLQGWFLMFSSLEDSNLLGVGFQMLGNNLNSLPIISTYIEKIAVTGFWNIEDAGFLAAKIISELGIIGIILVLMYIKFAFSAYNFLTKNKDGISNNNKDETIIKICSGIILAFTVEMFLRGIGYFSIGSLMTAVAIFTYNFKKTSNTK